MTRPAGRAHKPRLNLGPATSLLARIADALGVSLAELGAALDERRKRLRVSALTTAHTALE